MQKKSDNKNMINTKKCDAWCEMLLAIMRMTKELNDYERKYIINNFNIALSLIELQELKEKVGGQNV